MKFDLLVFCLVMMAGSCLAQEKGIKAAVLSKTSQTENTAPSKRIISLSPSVTEILFAIGQANQVVGVTRYCEFPPEAQSLAIVGGYLDTNFEKLLELQPDLVITIKEHKRAISQLERFQIAVEEVDHNRIQGILDSIVQLGKLCKAEEPAQALIGDIEKRRRHLELEITGRQKPKVLLSIGRNWGNSGISTLTIVGKDGFLNELISMAGGVNVYQGSVPFPQISREGLYALDPDIIIELVPDMKKRKLTAKQLLGEWHDIKNLKAVRAQRVFILSDTYMMIPGPRFILAAETLFRFFHSQDVLE